MRFIFRLEVSPEIGTGHFFRCLALAQQLIDGGWAEETALIFVARSLYQDFQEILKSNGIAYVNLHKTQDYFCRDDEKTWLGTDATRDAVEFANTLDLCSSDVVIVDNYAVNEEWCNCINARVATTVSFEDFRSQDFKTDLVVRGTNFCNVAVPNLGYPTTEYLEGSKYLVMRKELQGLKSIVRKDLNFILIYFGGADADNFTTRAVNAVLSTEYTGEIIVVVSNSFQYFDELYHSCWGEKRITIKQQPSNFIELMQTSSLLIGAGGINLWERVLLGLPSITIAIVPNQVPQVKFAKEHGLIFALDMNGMEFRLRSLLNTLLFQTEILQAQSEKCLKFLDSFGSHRVISRVISYHLKIRKARICDETLVHKLRNHPVVRAGSINNNEISIDEHKSWFRNALTQTDFLLLIAEVEGQPLGVVSFSEETTGLFRVSIYLNKFTKKSRGMGQYILRAAEKMLPAQSRFVATVLGDNGSSKQLFERANYKLERYEFLKGSNP